jgi:hypothetical protein
MKGASKKLLYIGDKNQLEQPHGIDISAKSKLGKIATWMGK